MTSKPRLVPARSTGAVVGIDLGTTYSLVAILEGKSPRVIRNALGETLTPSAVALDGDGHLVVGAAALALSTLAVTDSARWFKRDMGTARTQRLGSRELSPEELSSLVLRDLKHTAEYDLGRAVTEAVVTVPAYFGELQRRATKDACELAGLHCERIINEPTAAALVYGLHEREREARIVVLDLGGGTFDVTVLEMIEGVIEIQSTAGDARLGGEDFTDALTEHCSQRLERDVGEAVSRSGQSWARFRKACEQAKHDLTQQDTARLAVVELGLVSGRKVDWSVVLDRKDAEACWAPILGRLRSPISRALRDAKLDPQAVDDVLLVGGATRMPVVQQLASQLFGRIPLGTMPPDEAVAMGAAIQAALKVGDEAVDDLVVTDVAPFSLGVSTVSQVAGQSIDGVFSPIIERGTVLPASRAGQFATVHEGQTRLSVEVFQGEHSLCADNQALGKYLVKGIPKAPAGYPIEIRFSYDLNGILEVDTTVDGKVSSLTIEQSPGRLSKSDLQAAKKRLAQLKFHPREALPNVTTLQRAEALFVDHVGPTRGALGEYIAAFRAALESQDPRVIEDARARLNELISELQR